MMGPHAEIVGALQGDFMSLKNTVKAVPLTSLDSATFTGTFQAINPNGLPQACWQLHMTNLSNRTVFVSLDGTEEADVIAVGSTLTINSQQNMAPNNFVNKFAKGTVIYVSGAAAGTGLVYLAGYYQPNA